MAPDQNAVINILHSYVWNRFLYLYQTEQNALVRISHYALILLQTF